MNGNKFSDECARLRSQIAALPDDEQPTAKPKRKSKQKHVAETESAIRTSEEPVLCDRCGCKGVQHRAKDGLCPATTAWVRPAEFPSFVKLEGKELDDALADYWSGKTKFLPRT